MKKHFIFAAAIGVLFSFNAGAGAPSKTDVIQCGLDAGKRQGDERSAFVEGCLTVKYAARYPDTDPGLKQADSKNYCSQRAEKKQGAARKEFIEGCLKAKKEM